jgi:hypothetical protein
MSDVAVSGASGSARDAILNLQSRVNRDIIGQEAVVERLIIALLANGNVLVEGLPGLAKTRAIKSLANALQSEFRRIQFTPDLLPSDVTGGEIYRDDGHGSGTFEFREGPIFGNLILADEISRAPAKVQSALLEAMEERQVTVAGKRYKLPDLFMVLATQNPIEQEGTYPLPEAQMDRFLMHDLLALREGAATGLIAYGGSAHLVLPPTADKEVVLTMAQALSPQIMPRDGDQLADAVALAFQVSAGDQRGGSVLILADTVAPDQLAALRGMAKTTSNPPVAILSIIPRRSWRKRRL